MYSIILIAHIIISIILTIVACYIVVRSFIGLIKGLFFSNFLDFYIPVFAVVLLYLELLLGLLLYYMHMSKLEGFISQTNANDYFSSRFWAIEHTILMIFAIIFGHLALVYSKNLSNNIAKYKMNLLYFGLSFVLILISLTMNMLRNA
jgi:ABC-type uncharacterized transport system permease subunit